MQLSDEETAVLDFETQQWTYPGAKEQAIRETFGWSATRYFQVLNALLDRPDALAYAPLLVKRLQRLRSARAGQRSAHRISI